MKKTRWAVFGTGQMARDFVSELNLSETSEVIGVASKSEGRASQFAKEFRVPSNFGSYRKLIENVDADVVYIATTNDQHYDEAVMCAELGKALLVEKPICLRTSQLDRLYALCQSKETFLMEAMWMRCFPIIRELGEYLKPIGKIESIDATFCIDVPFKESSRLYSPALGGGVLYDLGVYPLNFIHLLFGFDHCEMDYKIKRGATGVDEIAECSIQYTDGRYAHFICSLRKFSSHRAVIKGEKGMAELEDFFHPSKLTIRPQNGEEKIFLGKYPLKGYLFEIEEVEKCLNSGLRESSLMPIAFSGRVLDTIENALNS